MTCTPGLLALLGWAPEDAPADLDALRRRLAPDEGEALDRTLAEAEAAGEPRAHAVRGAPPASEGAAGTAPRVRLVWCVGRDAEGRPDHAVATAEILWDAAPGALRAGEPQLREALDHLPHRVFVKDAEGRMWMANRASAAAYGRTPAEVEGRLQAELHGVPEEVERMLADDREVLASGRPKVVHEERFQDAEGRRGVLDTVKVPFRLHGRDLVLGVAVDVSDRRRALDVGAQLGVALRQAVEGIALVDANGITVFANPALAHMLDMREEDLVGAPFQVASTGSVEDESLLQEIERTIGAGEVWAGRYESRWKDGSRHVRDASVTPLRDAEGRFIGIVGVIRDVSREVELEEELHQAQKMEAVGRLAGGIAHDFNNVLTVISACAEELDETLPEGSPQREAAREISRAAERSAEIIGQLLAFSRRQSLRPERLDVNAVVLSLASMLERLLPDAVELETRLDPTAGAVLADRGQLERTLVNLVLNARDAMPEGGRLVIETAAEPGPGGPGETVRLSVRDAGVGMDRDTLARAFEPFFSTKGPGRGSGLGLAAVHGFARQSGGRIDVESEPGKGTVMHLRLPSAGPAEEVATRPPAVAATGGSAGCVLVVEDEDAIRALLQRTLLRAGYRVHTAADGREAMDALAGETDVDLVLADVRMPRMSGVELRAELARRPGTPRVLLMSGFPGSEFSGDVEPDVLAKPFRPSALLQAVRSALVRNADVS